MRPWRRKPCAEVVRATGILLGTLLCLNGCLTPQPEPKVQQVVLLWLKHPGRASDRAQVIRAAHSLHRVPGVIAVQAGRSIPDLHPAPPSDFDLAVVITFRDRAALQRYQRDPRYLGATRHYLPPRVRRYEVYNLTDR